jgi:hypothetical protein
VTDGSLNIQVNNGTPESEVPGDPIGPHPDPTGPWTIGGNLAGSPITLQGRVDALGVWNRVLDADECTALYNEGDGLEWPF